MSDAPIIEDIVADPLFVGLTRPATKWGIPYPAFVLEFMIITVIFLGSGNPLHMAFIIPVHGVLYLISSHDPAVFSLMIAWAKTAGRCQNRSYWGSTSFSPASVTRFIK